MKLGLKVSKSKRGHSNKLDENSSWYNRLRHSRLLAFLPFLLLATLIWILQTLQSDVVRSVYIPLGTRDISKSNGTQSKVPEFLEVQVKDKGMEHLRYELYTPDTIQLHLIEEHDGSEYIGILRRELSDALTARLSGTATVVQTSFNELKIAIHHRVEKKLPLRLGNTPPAPMGYAVSKVALSPDSIVVYGDADKLSSLKDIRTDYISDSLQPSGLNRVLKVILPSGVYSDVATTQVRISLDELTERSFSLPIYIENAPAGFAIMPLPGMADVTITIPRSKYNEASEGALRLSADFASLADGKDVLKLKLTKKPQWVIQARISPETIQFIKESKGNE